MGSKKRKISAALAAFSLFNSFSFALEKPNNTFNKKILKTTGNPANTTLKNNDHVRSKSNDHVRSKSVDNSNLKWKILTGIFSMSTVLELAGMYKQHKDNEKTIEDNKKQLNAVKQDLNAAEQDLNAAEKNIDGLNKKIELMKPQSHAFSLLKKKYTFKHQLHHGRQGSTAVFTDKDKKYVVVKTLFKSGSDSDLDEIQDEKKAVEFLKDKPKNEHMVFPIEYFEDSNFLFVVYPYIPWVEGSNNIYTPYLLNNFEKITDKFKEQFNEWDDNKKKKLVWHITKQLFEVYKYFYDNGFCHSDLGPNILVQLKKTENLDYNDFTIKIIDWGRWYKHDWKYRTTDDYPYQPMMPSFEGHYSIIINKLKNLCKSLGLVKEHKYSEGENCRHACDCCLNSLLSELSKYFGRKSSGYICTLPGFFEAVYWDPSGKQVYEDEFKKLKFAQSFDDLIDFCQKEIDKL